VRRFLATFGLFVPALAFAALPADPLSMPADAPVPASLSDVLRYLAMAVLVPIAASAAKLAAGAFQHWAEAKGAKWASAQAKVSALLADAVAFVDAETKAERIKILEDGRVSPAEAAQLQAHALEAAKRFLGANGLRLITDTLGVAAPALDDWLKGRLQALFLGIASAAKGPSAAEQMVGPVAHLFP
jgi:hypothetical protein